MPQPLTLTNGLLFVRELYLDTDTNNPALSDAELTRLANGHIHALHELVGPRLWWLTATACNGVIASGTAGQWPAFTFTTTQTDIDEIVGGFAESAAGDTRGVPLGRKDFQEIMSLRQDASEESNPKMFAAERLAAAPTDAALGKWQLWFWPFVATGAFVSIVCRRSATELSSGSDIPDLTPSETYSMWRLVAADAAFLTGNDHLVDRILAPLPQRIAEHYRVESRAARPRHGEHLSG